MKITSKPHFFAYIKTEVYNLACQISIQFKKYNLELYKPKLWF
jgi:hypothetical protein